MVSSRSKHPGSHSGMLKRSSHQLKDKKRNSRESWKISKRRINLSTRASLNILRPLKSWRKIKKKLEKKEPNWLWSLRERPRRSKIARKRRFKMKKREKREKNTVLEVRKLLKKRKWKRSLFQMKNWLLERIHNNNNLPLLTLLRLKRLLKKPSRFCMKNHDLRKSLKLSYLNMKRFLTKRKLSLILNSRRRCNSLAESQENLMKSSFLSLLIMQVFP